MIKKDLKRIRSEMDRWERTTLKKVLEKRRERYDEFISTSSKPIKRLYTPLDLEAVGFDNDTSIGYPGEFPYVRGIHPTMYRGQLWTMRQFSGFGTAEDTNGRYKFLLHHGETGLSVAFHLPTIYGYDSDHERSLGEVGKCGVAIDGLQDMEVLFSGIPLDKVTTSMTINAPAAMLLAMYISVAKKQGVEWSQVGGTIQNDILKEYMAQKTYIYPPRPSIRLISNTIEFCTKEVPRWNTISISGYHIREAGSTALQELAFTLADGMTYVASAIEAGMDVDDFAPRLSFFFNAHNDLFEEIAKYRAARKIWAQVMCDRFGAKKPRSWWLRFHTQTAGCSLTEQQPEINIVRVAIQALAAVMGGTQSLHTNSYDEAWALPTEDAVRIALRTQQIIAHESGVPNTIDPLGGSYYVEWLTNEMVEGTYNYFDKIESLGGVVRGIEKGFFQKEIADAAYRYQKEIDEKRRTIVGVNDFKSEQTEEINYLKVDDKVTSRQIRRLRLTRKRRDTKKVQGALDELRRSADKEDKNLMYPIIKAVQSYATIGELCDTLRDIWGDYEEPPIY